MIGSHFNVIARDHCIDRIDIPMIQQGFTKIKPIVIDNDVWIGDNVTILKRSMYIAIALLPQVLL